MGLFEVSVFLAGLFMVIIGLRMDQRKCPEPKVEYIPVPRTFKEEQESPIPPSEIFNDMFERATPFVGGFEIDVNPSRSDERFISQA